MSNIQIVEKQGKEIGKNVVILVGVHGNEVCGVKAVDQLLPILQIKSGNVMFIYANLEAIKQRKRFIEQNLNRCFLKKQPLEIKNSIEGKTAQEIIPYLDKADVLLDIHASFTKDSIPFVICDESNIEEAQIFDTEKIVCNLDPFEPGSTDYYMNLQKKLGFCFECGYVGDPKTNEIAQKAILDFLIYYGCIEGITCPTPRKEVIKITGLYKNKLGSFRRARYFKDFEKVEDKTLIGFDGRKKIYGENNKIVLFVRDRDTCNEECFLIGEYIKMNSYDAFQNQRNIIKLNKVESSEGGAK